tara:strand:+ start:3158 stop:3808 length:651 start_codon:yes stop_codon:yes gene_type:complete
MIKRILVSFLLVSSIIFSGSTNDGPVTVTSTGTIPFVVSFNSDGTGQDSADDLSEGAGNFANVDDDDYDRALDDVTENYFDIPDLLVCNDFDANHKFVVSLTKGGWTLPTDYTTSGDATLIKNTGGTDVGQFMVKVNVTNAGYVSDASKGLVTTSTFGTQYTGLSEAQTTIITGGENDHGVENGAFDVDGRVLFDWLKDIPGTYTVAVTISVVQGS